MTARHQRGEAQRDKARPDHAPIARIAIHLGQDVAEDIGQREEQHTGQERHAADQRHVHGRQLGRPDQVGAQQDADVRRHEEIVVAVLALGRCRRGGRRSSGGGSGFDPSIACRSIPSLRQPPRQCNGRAPAAYGGSISLQVCRTAEVRHLLEGPVALGEHIAGRRIDVQAPRIGQHHREQRALRARQPQRALMEEVARGGLDAVDAAAELDDVQIHLEDALLRPQGLDHDREHGLEALAHEAAARPEEQVLRHLLRDGAGAAQLVAALMRAHRLADRFEIEAGMERKLLVLGGDHRDGGLRRDLLERHPMILGAIVVLASEHRLYRAR